MRLRPSAVSARSTVSAWFVALLAAAAILALPSVALAVPTMVTMSPDVPLGAYGWYTAGQGPVSVSLTPLGPSLGSWYQWGDTVPGAWTYVTGPVWAEPGLHKLYYYSMDADGVPGTIESTTVKSGIAPITTTVKPRTLQPMTPRGMGDPNNFAGGGGVNFGGSTYVTFQNTVNGTSLWRFTASTNSALPVPLPGLTASDWCSSVAVFKNRLYFMTVRSTSTALVFRSEDGSSWGQPTSPFGVGANAVGGLTATAEAMYTVVRESGGWRVWRTEDGSAWVPVSAFGLDDTRDDTTEGVLVSARIAGVDYIYTWTQTAPGTSACLWRSADGTTWTRIGEPGFGYTGNVAFNVGQVGDTLYVGTAEGGGGSDIPGADLWKSSDGVNFVPVTLDGFGDASNRTFSPPIAVGSSQVVSVHNTGGFQLWGSSDGSSWGRMADKGAGTPSDVWGACATDSDGRLFFGTVNFQLGVGFFRLSPEVKAALSPSTPSGPDGWYAKAQSPKVSLSVDPPDAAIKYQWDAQASDGWVAYGAALDPPAGAHTLYFRGVLDGVPGAVGSLAIKAGLVGTVNSPAPITWTRVVSRGNGDTDAWFPWSQVVYGTKMYTAVQLYGGQGSKLYVTDGGAFTEVDLQSWGLPVGTSIRDMMVYGGKLLLATSTGLWAFDGTPPCEQLPALDYEVFHLGSFDGYLYASGSRMNGPVVSRWNGGTTWEEADSNASGGKVTASVDAFEVLGTSLYAAGSSPGGTQVWATQDGLHWTQANTDGFGLPQTNTYVQSAYVLGSKLYVGTLGENGSNGQIWRTANGTDWEPVTVDAFGGPERSGQAMAKGREYEGAYYVMIYCPTHHCRVYRSADDGASWTQVNEDGFGNLNCTGVPTLTVFDGRLWASTQNETDDFHGDGFDMYTIGTSTGGGTPSNPPVATPVPTPSVPNGDDGWYTTIPHLAFTTDRPAVVNYRLREGFGPWWALTHYTPGVSSDIPGPANGIYSMEYFAQDSEGLREDTKTAGVKVDTTLPAVVDGLVASDVTQNSVRLTWNPSTDTVSGLRGYGIACFLGGSQVATVSAGSATTYVVTGLQGGKTYTFRVRARDMAGNESAMSSEVEVVTPGAYEVPVTTGTNVTVSIPVGAAAPVSVTFPSVATAGQVSVTPVEAATAAPPLTNFHVVGSDYYNITPTATFSGRVRVTLPYDPVVVGSQASDLRLMHYNNHVAPAAWEDITVSVDTVNHTVTGETDSFSDFGLFLPDGTRSGATNVPASSEWSLLLIVAGAVALVALRRRSEWRAL